MTRDAVAALVVCLALSATAGAQELFIYQQSSPRWTSPENPTAAPGQGGLENKGGKGRAFTSIAAGGTLTLADVQGSGVIRRIWITIDDRSPRMLRALRVAMYWDGASTPAVSAPIGDFFGAGLGLLVPFENALFSSPEGRSFNASVPMPFRRGARIVLVNDSGVDLSHVFYDVDYTSEPVDAEALYFHSYWHRLHPTALGEDFEILPRVTGRGRYLGATVSVATDPAYGDSWWGEGELKIFLNGDRAHPTLIGTGTEDSIGSGWGQGVFVNRFQGSIVADTKRRAWVFYRLHIPDPIFFDSSCTVALQQIGGAPKAEVLRLQAAGVALTPVSVDPSDPSTGFVGLLATPSPVERVPDGWVNFYRRDDVSATAYFYLDRPDSTLPVIAPVADRVAALPQ